MRCVLLFGWNPQGRPVSFGYITAEQDEGFLVDHLYRTEPTCHIRWAYPAKEDVYIYIIQVADIDQIILQCKVVGESSMEYSVYFGEYKRYTESF